MGDVKRNKTGEVSEQIELELLELKECQARLIIPIPTTAYLKKKKSKKNKKTKLITLEHYLFHTDINVHTNKKSRRMKTLGGVIENWDKTVEERLKKEIEKETGTKILRCEPVLVEFGSRKNKETGELIQSAIHFYFGELQKTPPPGHLETEGMVPDKYGDLVDNIIHLSKEQVKTLSYGATYDAICRFSDLSKDKPYKVNYKIPAEYVRQVKEKTGREISDHCEIYFRLFRAKAKGGFKDLYVLVKTDLFWHNTRVQWPTKEQANLKKFIDNYLKSIEFQMEMRKLFLEEELFLKYFK